MNPTTTAKPKPSQTIVVPDFEQIPFQTDHITCPKCGKVQSAKILHTWPKYKYLHQCVDCGFKITKTDWKSIE